MDSHDSLNELLTPPPAAPDGPPDSSPDNSIRHRQSPLVIALAVGLLLGVAVSGIAFAVGLRIGKQRGAEQAKQRPRNYADSDLAAPATPHGNHTGMTSGPTMIRGDGWQTPEPSVATEASRGSAEPLSSDGVPTTWYFSPRQCVRLRAPMEIAGHPQRPGRFVLRLRQGANRLTREGTGLCEFVFRTSNHTMAWVRLRVRYYDECGNSLTCRIDGGEPMHIGGTKVFGQWLWRSVRTAVGPGLHRLTIQGLEDAVEIDRVIVSSHPSQESPATAADTPPPDFTHLPAAAPDLPAIGRFSTEAFFSHSRVVGPTHHNTVSVFVRANAPGTYHGEIRIDGECPPSRRQFRLDENDREQLHEFPLQLDGAFCAVRCTYRLPVNVRVFIDGEQIHAQRIYFVRPMSWAFLGPIPDLARAGLDLKLPGFDPRRLQSIADLPDVPGYQWKTVEDGSCYDDFGVVDLNQVFGYRNIPWSHQPHNITPMVAYAVTAIHSHGSNHDLLAMAGDDCLAVWQNQRPILQQRVDSPLETQRQVLGLPLRTGRNVFVFKVPQSGYYWQLLFEPDDSMPYGRYDDLWLLRRNYWP